MKLTWRSPPDLPSEPPTLVDVMHGRLERLHANRGFFGARCQVEGTDLEEVVLPGSLVGGNRWFMATPWNGCGETTAEGLPISACR